ncbi:DMT family transporter [Altererythrobacter sp.]|uniref:DMT family transporter n=1 Tax=Altererythrobacter sp. TaxID=1872480 RepID=UPI001B267E02|nr:DMT family transporter [Altererythrobacter sp.]MBO6609268.1 DMT family transporter [Altererythrobacter sp.]MBO6640731.1 DMT family transporter [Altererythrobacter sp.]MBO6708571.1 DMT family transporter [Altererythrobacter sp.]MBO6945291.1 DMT family transporter [Altererythrobacter sp.]
MENEGSPEANLVQRSQWLFLLALLAGNVALALGPWLVRLADTGPVSAGFWRLFLALPFLAVFARVSGQALTGIPRRTLMFVALGAVAFGLDLASWHVGIEMTRLGNATLFGNAGSIVMLFWGFIVARSLPRGMEWTAIVFALAGAAILMGRSADISATTLIGDLFCLAAGLLYAVYLVNLQGARQTVGGWSLLVWVSIFACPVLLSISLVKGEPIWPTDWTPILVLFVSSQLVGQGLLVFSMRHFPPLVIGLALLTQPAVAALIGYQVFGEVLTLLDIAGMALLGSALVLARGTRPATR